jgi:hypothetical protein
MYIVEFYLLREITTMKHIALTSAINNELQENVQLLLMLYKALNHT